MQTQLGDHTQNLKVQNWKREGDILVWTGDVKGGCRALSTLLLSWTLDETKASREETLERLSWMTSEEQDPWGLCLLPPLWPYLDSSSQPTPLSLSELCPSSCLSDPGLPWEFCRRLSHHLEFSALRLLHKEPQPAVQIRETFLSKVLPPQTPSSFYCLDISYFLCNT